MKPPSSVFKSLYVYVCMFVCLYTYRCVRVYKYISTGSYVYICIRVHGYTCMHMHSFIHLCIYMYINVYMRLQYFICVFDNFALKVYVWDYSIICVEYYILHIHMGWLRLVSSLRLWVSSAEYSLLYRALLQNRPVILRRIPIVGTPKPNED